MQYQQSLLNIKSIFIILFLSLIAIPSSAQNIHRFTEGLSIEASFTYGREAIYTDELLWYFYQHKLSTPVAGTTLDGKDDKALWTIVKADTSGFFRRQQNTATNLQQPNNPPGPGRIAQQSQNTTSAASTYRGPRPSYLYLTYHSYKEQAALLNIRGNSAVLINGEMHTGDPYRMGWLHIPVQLKKGLNEFYVRGSFIAATLSFPKNKIQIATEDLTLPDIVQGKQNQNLLIGLVLINTSNKNIHNIKIQSNTGGRKVISTAPVLMANSTRKIIVPIDASAINSLGEVQTDIAIWDKEKLIETKKIPLRSVSGNTPYRITFISKIDNSLQYYAVNPALGGEKAGDALFFSVHGAGVEALGQAQAYQAKDWGTLVAPTNRRPRGFNWEDWGRMDALEVLDLAQQTLKPDSQKIYLTGHSMGGHGTWFLGATYPEKWAAIAPCAGYPTLKGYGSADGLIPEKGRNMYEDILLKSGNQSDVIAYASNYKPLGIYVLHGDADRTVSVEYARQMRKLLGTFHPDFSYYEYPGGSHWYSNESVDWKPLFDYFKIHQRKTTNEVDHIDFKTANPGISATYYWSTIYQQIKPLDYSQIVLTRNLEKRTLIGKTDNVQILKLNLEGFQKNAPIKIDIDSSNTITYQWNTIEQSVVYLKKETQGWLVVERPKLDQKGPHRNGSFKEAFNHSMVYVYGTTGTKEENKWALEKVLHDAEAWYYRGNGTFDVIADRDFDAEKYIDRNIILIGNAKTNSAWNKLLTDCPITVTSDQIKIDKQTYKGNDLGGYFYWKKPGTETRGVGVITGTGLKGMQATGANQYFAGASGFPDYMFFNLDMLKNGPENIIDVGFYSNEWKIEAK